MIDVKILKRPKQGNLISSSGGFATAGTAAAIPSDCLQKLTRVLVPVDADQNELPWDAPLDKIWAVKSVKGIYSLEFLSARGMNSAESGVIGGINESELTQYLIDYAKKSDIPSLAGYATESWVKDQKYLTSHQSLAAYLKSADAASIYLTQTDAAAAYQPLENGKGLSANDFTDDLLAKLNGIESGANKYVHPSNGADTTITAGNGKVVSAITVNSLGHVTSVAGKSLVSADIPVLPISKITNLQSSLDAKLDKSVYETFKAMFDDMFLLETVNGVKRIKALHGLYTDEFLSARGLNTDGSSAGGSFGLLRSWPSTAPSDSTTDALGANLGWALHSSVNSLTSRVTTLEGKNYLDALSLSTSGSGNAVTAVSLSTDKKTITVTKGTTFLTSHQSLANHLYAFGSSDFDPATYDGYYAGMTTKSGITTDWWHILSMGWGTTNTIGSKTWASQLALPTQTRRGLRYRTGASATTYSDWVTVLDSGNYTSYVSKIGTSSVGSATRPIYLNAGVPTAGTYTFGNASGNAPISNGTVNTNLNADLLDGFHHSAFAKANQSPTVDLNTVNGIGMMCNPVNSNATSERHYPIQEAGCLIYCTAAYSSANQIYGSYSSNRWFARGGAGWDTDHPKTNWREFAFTDSNVASATKLQTARTLWGQSFDGTGNVSGNMTGVGEVYATGWFRTYGNRGWYNEDYKGGIYMSDLNWIRTYNSKALLVDVSNANSWGIGSHSLNALFQGANYASILLRVTNNSVAYGIAANTNGNMYFGKRTNGTADSHTNDAYLMVLNSTGLYIGGGSAPAYRLDVNGTARVSSLVIGSCTITYENGGLRFSSGIYSDGFVSAKGVNSSGSGSGSGVSYNRLDNWTDYASGKEGYVLSAKLGYDLYSNKLSKTDAAALYQPKGNYLTAHQSLANYVTLNTAQTISGVKTFSADAIVAKGKALQITSGENIVKTTGAWIHGGADCATSTDANLRFASWYGIGWYPTIANQAVPQGENAMWLNVRNGNLTVRGKFIKNGGTNSQALMADGSVRTVNLLNSVTNLGWSGTSGQLATINTLAYWNGQYASGSSNLQYCDRGRFGTMATATATDYLARSGGSMANTNVVTNLNADLLDGYHRSNLFSGADAWLSATTNLTQKIEVGGDANTYYPVMISVSSSKRMATRISVWKNLGSKTPSSYSGNHTNGTSSLWLLYEGRHTGWDGNGGFYRTIWRSMPYASLCAKTENNTNVFGGLIVWLRGGGCEYYVSATNAFTATVSLTEYTLGTSGSNTYKVAPVTELGNLGIINKTFRLYGNASTADQLATSRTLWGKSFDGTGNVSGDMTGVGTIYCQGTASSYREGLRIKPYSSWSTILLGGNDLTADSGTSTKSWIVGNNDGNFYINRGTSSTAQSPRLWGHANGWTVGNTATSSYALNTASFICDSWVRTKNSTGWYNETYGGGWYMTDTTWIRNFNNKSLYMSTATIRTDYLFDRQGYAGTSWNNGYGAYNTAITNNTAQTPLMVAYRAGQSPAVTGDDRLFAMELLNSGSELHLSFKGVTKFNFTSSGRLTTSSDIYCPSIYPTQMVRFPRAEGNSHYLEMNTSSERLLFCQMTNNTFVEARAWISWDGVFYAKTGIYSNGYVSARGQNTSDVRLKEQIQDFRATEILKALHPKAFKWNTVARHKFKVFDTDDVQYGLIAQEAKGVAPWLVAARLFDDDYLSIHYHKLIPVLHKGFIEHEDEITKLRRRVAELEKEVEQLKTA